METNTTIETLEKPQEKQSVIQAATEVLNPPPTQNPPVVQEQKQYREPPKVGISDEGVVTPTTLDEAYRYAQAIHKSGLAPSHFDTPEKILVGMQMAQELKLPALISLRSMYVVNGTPTLFGDLPKSLVLRSGLSEYFVEEQFDANKKKICEANENLEAECSYAVCRSKRRGYPEVTHTFTWAEALRAGLDKDKHGDKKTYKNYRRRMLQMRARTWHIKDEYSDVLNGIAIFEYDHFGDVKDVTETTPPPEKESLKDKLKNKKEKEGAA